MELCLLEITKIFLVRNFGVYLDGMSLADLKKNSSLSVQIKKKKKVFKLHECRLVSEAGHETVVYNFALTD